MKQIKYSICTTVFNNASRIKKSLDSISKYISDEFEIIVVDNKSTDGTTEILREYKNKIKNFKLIEKKCKRGKGRQIAFENSRGGYIIQIDLDTIYLPQWWKFIKAYEKSKFAGNTAIQCNYSGIYPRHLIKKIGGWRNLQITEDFDLWYKLIEIDSFRWCPLIVGENWDAKGKSWKNNPEARYAKTQFKWAYRLLINEKDRFIGAGKGYTIKDRLNELLKIQKHDYFWVFLITLSFYLSLFYNKSKRNIKELKKNWRVLMEDFKIKGKSDYKFITPLVRSN